jgi:hypothetical protein
MTSHSEKWFTGVIILILLNLALTLAGLWVLRTRQEEMLKRQEHQQAVIRRVDEYIRSWELYGYPEPENWDLKK